jgi:hypothetical protein
MTNDIVERLRCEHGVYYPHPCDDCEVEALNPANLIKMIERAEKDNDIQAAEITRLNQEIDALHAQIAHLKAGGNDARKYTRMGKQILAEDGEHFADGASEYAAAVALSALNSAD